MLFHEIEKTRRAKGLSVLALCRMSRVTPGMYWKLQKGKCVPRERTLKRLIDALDGKPARAPLPPIELISTTYRGYAAAISSRLGENPELMLSADPQTRATSNNDWSRAAKIRGMAVYCTVIELDLKGAEVGRAIGMTRQAVSQILKRVEDMRDDPVIDGMIEATGRLISGRAA